MPREGYLSNTQDIERNAQSSGVAFSFLRTLVLHRLVGLPDVRLLHSAVSRVMSVSRPSRELTIGACPSHANGPPRDAITVVSANLWHDWPRHRLQRERLEAFAHLIERESVDVALLQEVSRRPGLRVDQWLADRLGMAYVYTRANGHEAAIGFEEGLAVFSRFPLTSPRLRHLGTRANPFVRRMALGVDVDTPCGRLRVFSAHLGLLRRHNAHQLARLRSWVGATVAGCSALIGGDFNAHEGTPQIAQAQRAWVDTFRHLQPTADGTTHEQRWPWGGLLRRRLDYIFLHPGDRRWQVMEARHIDAPDGAHSDHRAVLTRLALEPCAD